MRGSRLEYLYMALNEIFLSLSGNKHALILNMKDLEKAIIGYCEKNTNSYVNQRHKHLNKFGKLKKEKP